MTSAGGAETDHDLIVRMDERVKQAVTIMEQRDIYHRAEMDRMGKLFLDTVNAFTTAITTLQANFVTRPEMMNHHELLKGSVGRLERIVYGACAVILLAVIGALMAMVLGGKTP